MPKITVLLKDWLQLTHLEFHALQMSRWSELAKIQNAKAALQQPLANAIEQWKTENPSEAVLKPFCYEISRLCALEVNKSELLAVRKREVREKILLLEQALCDLGCMAPVRAQAIKAA